MLIMPSKLRKAIGAVKDQTSLSLAKFSNTNCANLEITILKATSHDAVPIDDKYTQEILTLIASDKAYAAASAHAIAKRIGKTRNWIVAVKSLVLVLRIFQDGDPYFPVEVLHAMKRGAKILNLSNFRDDSSSYPVDFAAFVRNFALYLDDRLDCFVSGRLHRRFTYQRDRDSSAVRRNRRSGDPPAVVRDMKPAILLDRIRAWQKLLDRAIAAAPGPAARSNRLILTSLYAIVQETYDLYRDISDGLALLLDSFFHLQYQSCLAAFQACVKASNQFEELSAFYGTCKNLGVGRSSEYPSVHKISDELLETLQEFLKDPASFPGRSPPVAHFQAGPKNRRFGLEQNELELANSEDFGSACTSLEDMTSVGGGGGGEQNGMIGPSWSAEQEFYNTEEQAEDELASRSNGNISRSRSSQSLPAMGSCLDLVSFGDWPSSQSDHKKPQENVDGNGTTTSTNHEWELELVHTSPSTSIDNLESSNLCGQSSATQQQRYINPFLQDEIEIETETFASSANETTSGGGSSTTTMTDNGLANFAQEDLFSFPSSTMQALGPTFNAQNSNESTSVTTQNADHASILATPTTMVPTFCAQSPKESAMSPKLWLDFTNESSMAAAAPTYCEQSPKESVMSRPRSWSCFANERAVSPTTTLTPPFCVQNSNETAPKFAAHSSEEKTLAATSCSQQNTTEMPTFCARDTNPSQMGMPTFSSWDTNFSQMATPTFSAWDKNSSSAQNPKENGMGTTFRAEISNSTTAMEPTFHVDKLNDFGAAPTFSARSENATTGAFSSRENDPFASFPNGTASAPMCNGFNQESLLNQQRLWLEQQNKIIAKHMA